MTKKGYKQTAEHIQNNIAARKGKKRGKTPKSIVEKHRQGQLKYYQTHHAWNFGLSWPDDIKERIRESSIRSGVGKWNGSNNKHNDNQIEVIGQE